jgi:hypothetical protein
VMYTFGEIGTESFKFSGNTTYCEARASFAVAGNTNQNSKKTNANG